MENIQNIEKKCYIVSLDNGIREEEPISMEVFNTFNDGSQLVQLNKTVFGVYKSNSLNPETMYIDDFDIIKADISELLDIDHEETKRVVNEEENIGIFTVLNYSKDMETRISATTILNHLIEYINNHNVKDEDLNWLTNTLNNKSDFSNPIQDKNIIKNIINIGKYALVKDIETHTNIPMNDKSKSALEKAYVRMILFDILVGRKYRGLDYNIICSTNEAGIPLWIDSHFGPISVSSSIEKEKQVPDNRYYINNQVIDKKVLLEVLFETFYEDIKKITESLNEATRLYKDAIIRIIYNNTEIEKATELEDIIDSNLNKIKNKQQEKEKNMSKEHRMNKVEKTMATQSLNVKVTTKLDLIQKKYPINPKEYPNALENLRKKTKEDQKAEIELMVERENNKSGFVSTAVIISIVAFVIGFASSIAYVILYLGN